MTKGWRREPMRHALARKGVKTGRKRLPASRRTDFPKGKGLNRHTAIYVPSTTSADKPITREEHMRRARQAEQFLSKQFGGYTTIETKGGWVSETKGLIKEPVLVVHSYTTKEEYDKKDLKVKAFLEAKKKAWGQESMSFEYQDSLHFV
jgi:hypothetical protein